jgi:ribosome-associated protein
VRKEFLQSDNGGSTVSDIKKLVCSLLEDGKAENIVAIELAGKSDVADYMIVASGTSSRHTSALASQILDKLKGTDYVLSAEGMNEGNWVLLDIGGVVVHIFKPEMRAIYNLEKMWDVTMVPSEARTPELVS